MKLFRPSATPVAQHNTATTMLRRGRNPAHATSGFTLLEVLLGLIVFSVVLVVAHSVFYGALQLRNKSAASIDAALPLQHTLALLKRDLANLTPPGGTLTGTLQTTPTTTSSSTLNHAGTQVGPAFYTAAGTLNETTPWSELRKVTYYLLPGTNNTAGRQLVRSVTRNLLPVLTEEYEDQTLLNDVEDLTFEFYNGTQWVTTWDSTTSTNGLPTGIRAALTLVNPQSGVADAVPIELIVPVFAQGGTNSTATGGGQ
jgi:type II secretion system protein J